MEARATGIAATIEARTAGAATGIAALAIIRKSEIEATTEGMTATGIP